jgi:hypothetical protein
MSDNHTTRGTMQDQLTRIVTYLRHGRRVSPHIVIGPIVWQPKDDGRLWYFVVPPVTARAPVSINLAALRRNSRRNSNPLCSSP